MNTLRVLHRIRPAEIVVPGVSPDIAEHGASMSFPCLRSAPNIVDQFVIIEREEARNIPMPFRQIHTATQIQFVIFPNSYDRRHHLDRQRKFANPLSNPPGLRRVLSQFFVQPIAVHDMEVNLFGPITIQRFVGRSPMSNPMQRILICTRTDLESKVK